MLKWVIALALAGSAFLHAQEPPLPSATETPAASPSPAGSRPQVNIPEIPISVEPPSLVPSTLPAETAAPKKTAPPLTELDAAFKQTPIGQAAEEYRLHVEWRQLQNRTVQDAEVVAARKQVNAAKTDLEKRTRLRAYYKIYYAHMSALAQTPELKNYLEVKKNEVLNGLAQPRVRPVSSPTRKSQP